MLEITSPGQRISSNNRDLSELGGLQRQKLRRRYFEIKRGFLGAYGVDGLTGGLFTQLTRELRAALPGAVGDSILRQLVSFKYSNAFDAARQQGNRPHGDSSHVNLALWLTPDVASLDASANGITIWDVAIASQRDFAEFGRLEDAHGLMERLDAERGGLARVTVPRVPPAPVSLRRLAAARDAPRRYRRNRMTIFHSKRIHATGAPGRPLAFRPGYVARRNTLSWLFGLPHWERDDPAGDAYVDGPPRAGLGLF